MDANQTPTPEQIHESNKVIREALAWAHYKIGVTPLLLEEHQDAMRARGVLESLCADLQKKIEAVEPPQKKDTKADQRKPYVVEVPMPEAQQ